VLVREYAGRLSFYHCDAYRVRTLDELLALGIEEMLDDRASVVAIEWADRFPRVVPAETFRVELDYAGDRARRIHITPPNAARGAELARQLEEPEQPGPAL
jgi:tRNA threonylcarbamoyladenosine biosynthesis protein TsaE